MASSPLPSSCSPLSGSDLASVDAARPIKTRRRSSVLGDRFIPVRSPEVVAPAWIQHGNKEKGPDGNVLADESCKQYSRALHSLDDGCATVLHHKASPSRSSLENALSCSPLAATRTAQVLAGTPPSPPTFDGVRKPCCSVNMSVTDDFYFNVLDWSSSGVIATAHQNEVKLFTLDIGQYCKYTLSRTCCSLAWHSDGHRLAFGNNAGALAVLDVVKKELVVRRHQHCSRVASLAWIGDSLVSGGADGTIASWDCRTARVDWLRSPNGQNVHRGIVCGLKYNESTGLLASGANDNRVVIWDMRTNTYLMQGMHRAAVKALAWSPHRRNTLMTGAGTFDKRIRIWDLAGDKMNCLREHNTGSQVCNAIWSPVTGEILTSHGYTTNHLALWRWSPDSHQLYARATMAGHTDRVLHMAGSPVDTRLVVSAGGAGDSMMHFWKVFERQKEPTASPSLLDLPTMR